MSSVGHRTFNEAVSEAAELPLDTRFSLGEYLTDVQIEFLEINGFLVFDQVATADEVGAINAEVDRLQAEWIAEGTSSIFGVPIFQGRDEWGDPLVQRLPFTSHFSSFIGNFVRDKRFEPIRLLVGEDARVGDQEKDGCVVNNYINIPGSVYPRLGWHTDGLRDLFYLRYPQRMLNVGLHLTDCPASNGGLRLVPGTHHQGLFNMCFHKPYFISHRPDPNEVVVETQAGDLTVHDGRLWHRVARSPHTGRKSFRRSMYVPYLTDAYAPKSEGSSTPLYHRLGMGIRRLKNRLFDSGKSTS